MPRKSSVCWYESRKSYYAWIDGVQNWLGNGPDDRPAGPNYRKACEKLHSYLTGQAAFQAGEDNPVGLVLAKYLKHVEGKRKPSTVRTRQLSFRDFAADLGEVRVGQLTHRQVSDFLERMRRSRKDPKTGRRRRWTDGSVRTFLCGVQAAFNWAALPTVKLIPHNPLIGFECPGPRSLSRACLITAEQHKKVCDLAGAALGQVLVCLEGTGARPGELIAAEAKDWREDMQALVYYPDTTRADDEFSHKTSQHKPRFILFGGEALAVLRGLMRRHPRGRLFRKPNGKPWNLHELDDSFRRVRDKLGYSHLVLKSYRHAFATNFLTKNKNIDQLAALMGNTPAVIRHHYAHLLADTDALRAALHAVRPDLALPANPEGGLRVIG